MNNINIFCTQCGEKLDISDKFCSKCGKPIIDRISRLATIHSVKIAPLSSFRDLTLLLRYLKIFLYILILTTASVIFSNILQYQLLSSFKLDIYQTNEFIRLAELNDKRQSIISLVQLGFDLITFFIFLIWIYRINSNCHALGAKNMKFTPGWAVGYYFIPIICLWRPYQVMKEMYKASKNPINWKNENYSMILNWWWLLFITSGLLYILAFNYVMQFKDIDYLINATQILIISDCLKIITTILALIIADKIYKMQMSHACS